MQTMEGADNTKNNQTVGRPRRWIVFGNRMQVDSSGVWTTIVQRVRKGTKSSSSSFFFFRQNGLSALGKFQPSQTAACVHYIICKLPPNFIKWQPLRYCMSLPSFEDGKRLVSNEFSPRFYNVAPPLALRDRQNTLRSLGFYKISSKLGSDSHVPWPSSKVNISR